MGAFDTHLSRGRNNRRSGWEVRPPSKLWRSRSCAGRTLVRMREDGSPSVEDRSRLPPTGRTRVIEAASSPLEPPPPIAPSGGRRLLDPVAMHELSYHQLGEQLVERRLVPFARRSDLARGRQPASPERVLNCRASRPACHHHSIAT